MVICNNLRRILMESFELTFYCKKNHCKEDSISIINECVSKNNFFEKEVVTEVFNDDKKDYKELQISIFDLVLSKDNFNNVFKELSKFVSVIFEKIPDIPFATGIYELTYYLIENKNLLKEFDSLFLNKFPIVFLRPKNYVEGQILFQNENVLCIFNESAQVLY
jgi:hypothetical protein